MFKGLSVWISFGKYAGWKWEVGFSGPTMIRIVAGWVAFVIIAIDVDKFIGTVITEKSNK